MVAFSQRNEVHVVNVYARMEEVWCLAVAAFYAICGIMMFALCFVCFGAKQGVVGYIKQIRNCAMGYLVIVIKWKGLKV